MQIEKITFVLQAVKLTLCQLECSMKGKRVTDSSSFTG